jgi:formylglycine-generating enzyme required for sulfatase activity
MSDIFISYKREEQPTARKLADALEREGWTVWWDPKLRAGDDFDEVIEAVLKASRCVIVLWSEMSLKSKYVRAEAVEALEQGKLVPVAIENVNLPFRFKRLHTPKLLNWDGSSETADFRKLIGDISAIIGSPGRQPGNIFRDTLKDGSSGPEMVVIPVGSFQMGDIHGMGEDNERPVHTVNIQKSIAMGRYPVTFDEFDYFAKVTGCPSPDDGGSVRGQRPVIYVSWYDAVGYANWLSEQTRKRYRLPTEAEWEYAARSGGKEEIWSGTSRDHELGGYAWYYENSGHMLQPVGLKKPNGIGLYDMSGNVWEWVEDCWHQNYEAAPKDGSAWLQSQGGDCGERVIRGGSFNFDPPSLRSSLRNQMTTDDQRMGIGFRLARDID